MIRDKFLFKAHGRRSLLESSAGGNVFLVSAVGGTLSSLRELHLHVSF